MKKIFFVVFLFLLTSCGGGGGESLGTGEEKPQYKETVLRWTGYGDSTMTHLGARWKTWFGEEEPFANYGISGSRIELFLKYPDPYVRDRVVLMTGANNLFKYKETVEETVTAYWKLLLTIKASRVYCVSLSPALTTEANLQKIKEVNKAIKGMCGEDFYIESWDFYSASDSLVDEVHHSAAFDERITNEILRREVWLNKNSQ